MRGAHEGGPQAEANREGAEARSGWVAGLRVAPSPGSASSSHRFQRGWHGPAVLRGPGARAGGAGVGRRGELSAAEPRPSLLAGEAQESGEEAGGGAWCWRAVQLRLLL